MLNFSDPSTDKKSFDPSMHCNYCGEKLKAPGDYCSEFCEQQDSVWHHENDF